MVAVAAIALGACSKEAANAGQDPNNDVKSFRDLQVPTGFDFKGTKTITVKIEKQEHLPIDLKSVYRIDDQKGNALLKYNLEVAQGLEAELEVPIGTEELYLVDSYGLKRAVKIENNNLIIKSL